MQSSFCMPVLLAVLGAGSILAQPTAVCTTNATPPLVRAEGLTERIGDILLTCTGTPGNTINANITISLNTNITNRVSSASTLMGIVFTIDSGSGPQPFVNPPLYFTPTALTYQGVSITFSSQGTADLLFQGIRANATGVPLQASIVASISINNAGLALNSSQIVVGTTRRGLFATYGFALICAQTGSPLPQTVDFSHLIAAGTAFSSTRITEGFGDAFQPRSGWENFNADSGERILVQYSGFSSDSQVYVPDVIAGSDTIQPTSAGDFGLPVSGGAYAPSASGSLLLARVNGASSSGAGGSPVYTPGAPGSGSVTFNTVTQIPIASDGSAYVVYEVVDANPSAIEYAVHPTFLGLAPDGGRNPSITGEEDFFAPSSNVATATASDPLPRFYPDVALPDCSIIGDCDPNPPQLSVNPSSLSFTAKAGSGVQAINLAITNAGGGIMPWEALMNYTNGTGWLSVTLSEGFGNATVQLVAEPQKLAPGTYNGTLTIDAGPVAGTVDIPVSFTITAPVTPAITSVINAATFLSGPVVAGSISTLMGSLFGGENLSASFNGIPAQILFSNNTQINLVVPPSLSSQTSAQVIVSAGGETSQPFNVTVAPFEPGIFNGGIVNQDGTVNSASSGAAPGSIIAMWGTGLSGTGVITGNIGGQTIATPYYAGPAPGLPGVQQVNLMVPTDLSAGPTQVYLCATPPGGSQVCSVPVPLTIN